MNLLFLSSIVSNVSEVKTANHSSWMNVQRAKLFEEKMTDEEIVECPRSEDVIFKKGPGYRNNPGNLYYRALVEAAGDEHQKAENEEKYQVTLRIIEKIEKINGRFLDWSKARKMWIVNEDRSKIHSKVASTIKQYNRQRAESRQLQNTIDLAASVVKLQHRSNHNSLRNPYFTQLANSAKRRKVLEACTVFNCGDTTKAVDDNFCFGKTFYPP